MKWGENSINYSYLVSTKWDTANIVIKQDIQQGVVKKKNHQINLLKNSKSKEQKLLRKIKIIYWTERKLAKRIMRSIKNIKRKIVKNAWGN